MRTLTVCQMRTVHGAVRQSPRWPARGVPCGILTSLVFGLAVTGHFVAAASIYMVTPVGCLFDIRL